MGIILASASPRRRDLLSLADINFKVEPSDMNELLPENITPSQAVTSLARGKAEDIFGKHPNDTVLSADTVVSLEGEILGKPADDVDAFRMLKMLSGRTHKVYTGVCIMSSEKTVVFDESTDVTFYELTDSEIYDYIATKEPADKAGAYGIQGKGSLLVKCINGDYFNVVGLPLARTVKELKKFPE